MYKNLAAALAAACFFPPLHAQAPAPVKAAWVYVTPLTDAGWTRQHDEGRRAVEAALGAQVQTTFVENVAAGAAAALSLIHICRCPRPTPSRSRWSP